MRTPENPLRRVFCLVEGDGVLGINGTMHLAIVIRGQHLAPSQCGREFPMVDSGVATGDQEDDATGGSAETPASCRRLASCLSQPPAPRRSAAHAKKTKSQLQRVNARHGRAGVPAWGCGQAAVRV